MTTELSTDVVIDPGALVAMAIEKGSGLDTVKELMDLQERHEKSLARKAYHRAMAAFKKNPPTIKKTATVDFTNKKNVRTYYKHADLAVITEIINASLSEHDLHASWQTNQPDGKIEVTCTITHIDGYSESTSLSAGADGSGGKNAIQGIGSTVSYLERYTLLALTGLAAGSEDDDGRSAGNGGQANGNQQAGKGPGALEQWLIKAEDAAEFGCSEDVIAFWKKNSAAIKKDLKSDDAARVYDRVLSLKNKLKAAEEAYAA